MKKTKIETVSLVQGELPKKEKKETYDWETKPKRTLEPWHLSSIALIGDLLILLMYMFLNVGVAYQLPIGLVVLILGFILIGASYYMLHKKIWPISVTRYTNLINVVAICITVVVAGLTLLFL